MAGRPEAGDVCIGRFAGWKEAAKFILAAEKEAGIEALAVYMEGGVSAARACEEMVCDPSNNYTHVWGSDDKLYIFGESA